MGGSISSHFVGLPGGLLMSVIAFSIVFLVIAGLMAMMMALKAFAGAMEAASKASQAVPAASPASTPTAPGNTPTAAVVSPASDDDELVAVITAAITAICGVGARIVGLAPTVAGVQSTAWRMTGRLQNSEGFAD